FEVLAHDDENFTSKFAKNIALLEENDFKMRFQAKDMKPKAFICWEMCTTKRNNFESIVLTMRRIWVLRGTTRVQIFPKNRVMFVFK
ncbi:hypothetical protein, partial [Escherichia coli]|uniref:hypothetical protein n=1 Tax=Escherichia coli TaxID=562 RepID=UPI001AA0C4A0